MRLQLTRAGLAALALLGAAPAHADWSGGVDARSSIYQDTDRTTIFTTIAGAHVSPKEQWTINGHYLADIITSASVDVVTSATSRAPCAIASPSTPADQCVQAPFHETRHEGAGSLVFADGTNTATLGYVYSVENDWRSHSFSGGYSRDFFNHQLTLGLSGSFTTNAVGRSHDLFFHRTLNQGSASFDVGVVASKRDLVTVGYTWMYLKGFQSSPYRFVFFHDSLVPDQLVGSAEVDPETRIRHALALRWNHHAFTDTAIKSHVRAYADSWGVISGTAGTEYVVGFGDLELGVFARGYVQKGASFWQDDYDKRMKYMTADRELSPFIDAYGGLRFMWERTRRLAFFESLKAEVKGSAFAFKFLDFHRLPTRQGIIGEIALGAAL
jgi:hypothetical protein